MSNSEISRGGTPFDSSIRLALDFDGVLCDSVCETGISAWNACAVIWPEMSGGLPSEALLADYGRVRPVVETGHEAILVMRLLEMGVAPAEVIGRFPTWKARLLAEIDRDEDALKGLFGAVRDRCIATDAEGWSAMSPLYPGIKTFLQGLSAVVDAYIITTKQERFVRRLLDYNGVAFPSDRIFGLDRGVPKEAVLSDLSKRHPGSCWHFVEDRLATLVRVMECADLAPVRLYLANWGYNTRLDRESARGLKIAILDLCDLLALTFPEDNQ
uniref:Phosphoglycolate phosphatase, HAD superfamily n=1 Tax=Candidatus Kentrum sp. LFY TaxID=2126342 RepID=A0A450WPV3_9GAMM|nr:MAG: Phosphoglycolate phosphatase, HAD superfamily [Candidatus Kentron sp. LFY]